ncbi:hypothetical protein LIER_05585 [Lithospermum erythrorhizon]|uniref:Uncharacterized protein n=1 Tax=Lithospermum erythrorhizon TaxID=34254 RepID=A0AAV3P2V3_LITER
MLQVSSSTDLTLISGQYRQDAAILSCLISSLFEEVAPNSVDKPTSKTYPLPDAKSQLMAHEYMLAKALGLQSSPSTIYWGLCCLLWYQSGLVAVTETAYGEQVLY